MRSFQLVCLLVVLSCRTAALSAAPDSPNHAPDDTDRFAQMFVDYFEQMSVPKPFVVRTGEEFRAHQQYLRPRILQCLNLDPQTEPSDWPAELIELSPLHRPNHPPQEYIN